MIIIGTEKEIEAMINEACPYCVSIIKCDGDCRACWNRSASIVIVRPEKVGMIKKDIDGFSFLECMKEGDRNE